jgi:NodT family efflux transporter outer membrane factor (OMF) lipoprotein
MDVSFARIGRWAFALGGIALLAAGCTSPSEYWHNGLKVGPNYQEPEASVAPAWSESIKDSNAKPLPLDGGAWWTAFQDPVLDTLIRTAFEQNLDLQTAAVRILEAVGQRNVAVGNLFPQSQTATGNYADVRLPQSLGGGLSLPSNINLWTTGFNASWELDFWGRFRRSVESANANRDASVEDYNDALVILLAEVATEYVHARGYQQRLRLVRHNVELQKAALEIADARFKKGATVETDVQQARSNLAQTESLVPPLMASLRQANNRLCTLLGTPTRDLIADSPANAIPAAPKEVAIGIPADLLRRRPDIRRAEREVASQSAQIGIAEADLYPRFAVTGFIGYAADDFANLFASRSFTGLILPNFTWNILNYGRVINGVRIQEARFQERVLAYRQTVLRAGQESEDALVAFVQSQDQVKHLQESVEAAARTEQLVAVQYKAGTADFNRVFTAQSFLATQQDQLTAAQANVALNLIALYRALGGGWEFRLASDGSQHSFKPAAIQLPAPQIVVDEVKQ